MMAKPPRRAAMLCVAATMLAFTAGAAPRALSLAGSAAPPDSAQSPDSTWKQDSFHWTFPDLPEILSPATSVNSRSNSGAPTVTIPR